MTLAVGSQKARGGWPRMTKYAILLVLAALAGGGWWFYHRLGQARWQIDELIENDHRFSATEARDAWERAVRQMGLAYYALPAEKKAQPYWRLCAKFLAEGDYSRSFEMFRRAYDLAPEPSLHLGAYLAALAKEADWLRVLIAQPPAACSPEDLRYFRACLAWAAETPAAVLAVSEEPVQAAPKDEARPPRGLLWLRFMRARALMEMGRNTSAFDILDNQVGPHLKIMTNDPRVAINFATVVVQAGEKCGEYRQALVCALLAADFLDRVEDKSWDGTRRELRESIARLKERLGSASETANPVSVRPSAPARE